MFRYYLRLIFRNFKRFKGSFFINLIGLSTGIACALLIYLWVNDELQVDKFHENSDRLFQVLENRVNANGILTSETNSGPMGKALKEDMPEVAYAASVVPPGWTGEHLLSTGEHAISARGQYAGEDYFKMFSYPLLQGNKNQVLANKNGIVISEDLARRLFGDSETAMGKILEIDHDEQFMISGVFEDIPRKSSVQFDFVLPYDKFTEGTEWTTSWQNTGPRTYLMLKKGADAAQFNAKIADYIKIKNNYNPEEMNRTTFIASYSGRYLHNKYENGELVGGRIEYVRLFSVIAGFLLVIACINFMNLFTAKAAVRTREVGVRKAVGAHRRALIFQYLSESVLMAVLSLFIAVTIVWLLLPQFNTITGKQLTLSLDLNFILSCLGIALFTGVLAGSYPAFYLSGFRPALVLKGKLSTNAGELWIRKGLVIFQFTLSIILIVSVLVVYRQIEYVQTTNLGYEKEHLIYFERAGKLEDEKTRETFLSEVKKDPGIVNASNMGHYLQGHNSGTSGIEWPGKDPNDRTEFEQVAVNYGMVETLDIKIKEGRTFSPDFSSDSSGIIFNEAAIAFMGLTDPIGKTVKLWGEDMRIIGVVKNFHFESLHEKVKPLFFRLAPNSAWVFMVRIRPGMEQESIARLGALYQTFNPGFAFDYQFLDEDYRAMYAAERRVATLSGYFAGIAILISCLGLFGMAAFTAERRQKEIGIRKVLGASVNSIMTLLSKDFIRLVLIALFIATPVAWYVMSRWLQDFAYQVDIEWWIFVVAGVSAMTIALLAVGSQSVKAALVNPVRSLRSE